MATLKVKNGHGCRVARIDKELFYSLGMTLNLLRYGGRYQLDDNVAEIISEDCGKRTVARCLFHHSRDHGKGIIRLDNLTRNYAGLDIGERVVIKKAKKVSAEKVRMTISQAVSSDEAHHLANLMNGHVLMRGEKDIGYWSDGIDQL